jgi:pimeloyl-ACP methyl ester carboxylesterase
MVAADLTQGPADLALTFRSPVSGANQPYRLCLPTAHDGKTSVPLFIALHGTNGDHNKYLDHPTYGAGIYKREAERRGIAILCPSEGDPWKLPTEWRGLGEVNVLACLEDVCRRFRIDRDRVVLSGQSMGGTGTTYLCCRYPDLFAAGIPLASTYSHLSLITNLRYVPMFYVHGAKDWPIYAATGPIPITKEMRRLGYNGELWMIPDVEHNTMLVSTERVLDWALQQRLVRHPRHVVHRAYLPVHGRAYWTEIQKLTTVGGFAELDACIEEGNRIAVTLANTAQAALRPESELLDLTKPITVTVNGAAALSAVCGNDQEIRITAKGGGFVAAAVPRVVRRRTEWRGHPIGTVVSTPDWKGTAETALGSWTADAICEVAGADIALTTWSHHRGIPPEPGQTVDIMDLINWLRPCDTSIASFNLRGDALLAILEENIRDLPRGERFLIQVSGCRYRFDRSRPQGQRIVFSDIDPAREYSIVTPSHNLTRTDTMYIADRNKVPFQHLDLTVLTAAWHYIEKCGGKIQSKPDGRVTDAGPVAANLQSMR